MLAGVGAANGVDEDDESAGVGFDRPDHAAVFDLSMDYSDDDVLLDWEQYSGAHAHRVFATTVGHFVMSCKRSGWLCTAAALHAYRRSKHITQNPPEPSLGDLTCVMLRCSWKEVHVHGAGCDLAGKSVPLVPLLGASRMVSTLLP